ncbi:Vacuolar protein sorting-associated protein 13 [Elsinoe australis]|uniref:Vacuolar protein sorting-associated protein 13 n=1 Tax=Elsinoe australis TaxID=40998 RepID=A0A2P8A2X3_9PEZI|nr:Vacuolar protein sorting-associated protein 13 [Elsinoe australis]
MVQEVGYYSLGLDGFMHSKVRDLDDFAAKMQARAQPTPASISYVHKRKAKKGGSTIMKGVKEVFDGIGGMVDVQRWRIKKASKRAEIMARRAKMRIKNAGRRESYVSYTGSVG